MTDAARDDRPDLAALALGRLDGAEQAALEARLEADPELRRELSELRALVDLLTLVDGERLGEPGGPPDHLETAVVEAVAREQERARRRRRRRTALVSGIAAAVLVVALLVGLSLGGDESDTSPFETTSEGAAGAFAIEAQPWGTEIELDVTGLTRGEIYWLWLSDADGNRSGAGTFRGSPDDQTLTMASALPVAEAARIWVTDEDDAIVLDAALR
jgi:hypothetical protein